MNKQEREEARALHEAAIALIDELHCERLEYHEYMGLRNSLDDLPAALDALDEMEEELGEARECISRLNADGCAMEVDRNRWKAEAEMLESALKEGQCCIACTNRPGCGEESDCPAFEFNQARFESEYEAPQ